MGSWLLIPSALTLRWEPDSYTGDGSLETPDLSSEVTLVYISPSGVRSTPVPIGTARHRVQEEEESAIEVLALHDVDDDGRAELFLRVWKRFYEGGEQRIIVVTWTSRGVAEHPDAPVGVTGVTDFDGDGRPDLVAEHRVSDVETDPVVRRWRAVCDANDRSVTTDVLPVLHRSVPGGPWEVDDQVTERWIREHCELLWSGSAGPGP